MPQLKKNIISNFIGNGWMAILTIILVPFYLRFLGVESYGLIGFFTTLQILFSFLASGMSFTLNRELARLTVEGDKENKMRELVRTFEAVNWLICLAVGVIFVFISSPISVYWIKPRALSIGTVEQAVFLMGLGIAFHSPFALYFAGLMGLQRQVLCNILLVFIATFRGVGAVLILWLVSASIQAFFIWIACASILQTILGAIFLWSSLNKVKTRPKIKISILFKHWKFAAGTSGIKILHSILEQSDKFILSMMVSLETFGLYSLAKVVASSLSLIIQPIFVGVFPRFSQLVAKGETQHLIHIYKGAFQFALVTLLPIDMVVLFFTPQIILLWTDDQIIVQNSRNLIRILSIGTFFEALTYVPFALQLAYGWTRMAFYQSLVFVLISLPLFMLGIRFYGAMGAAYVWLLINFGYILVWLPYMQRQFFPKQGSISGIRDIIATIVGVLIVSYVGHVFFPSNVSRITEITYLIAVLIVAFGICLWFMPLTREIFKKLALRLLNSSYLGLNIS